MSLICLTFSSQNISPRLSGVGGKKGYIFSNFLSPIMLAGNSLGIDLIRKLKQNFVLKLVLSPMHHHIIAKKQTKFDLLNPSFLLFSKAGAIKKKINK